MKNLAPYLSFPGNCREAFNFYKDVFNGEIVSMRTFGEADMQADESAKDRILHAELKAEEMLLFGSDGRLDFNAVPGNQVSLNVGMTDQVEQEKIFNALAAGGQVAMPLNTTFWGARFGMVVDRFGIRWMLNCTPGQ